MDLKDIERLAKLTRLALSDEEKKEFAGEFEKILVYIGEIKKAAGEVASPEAGGLRNVMRPDLPAGSPLATPEELMQEAPKQNNGFIEVPQMFS
ncbi:Asp-tRNA(Asn)/Glu-tRNA(Gln) amidotransferase subunit GatC [Candidatus Parcubacteria bacterium]|nr:Asp-tRNA(Asn)/Glu-tRNA(Gln) amidotransferase subunit GatC [Candidatus Parcubacteria bacterium]